MTGIQLQLPAVAAGTVNPAAGRDDDMAPQWRGLNYVGLTCKSIRLPDLKPRPLGWCTECGGDVR